MERCVVSGTPNAIVDKLAEYVDAGCDHFIMVSPIDAPGRDGLEMLRTEVMPHFG
jgi:alkanesulfonate monooxygenase SsuD/methylene tetrahydromethanopterin reductase-like flavin-dependent oxidoreductase (luciferase family)